jgi:hypothetical protein
MNNLHFFLVILLTGLAIGSPSNKEIYNNTKTRLTSFVKAKYIISRKVLRVYDYECESALRSLTNMDAESLVTLWNDDLSEEFLIIFFFSHFDFVEPILVFRCANSLSHFKDRPDKDIPMKRIFDGFRVFLLKTFAKVKSECCSDAFDLSGKYELLKKFEDLWNNRLEPLARTLLSKMEYIEQSKQIRERIRFLYRFLEYGLEFLLRHEFKRLHSDIRKVGIKNSSAVKNFHFLSIHLGNHLRNSDSPRILYWLEMVSKKPERFIVYFLGIYYTPFGFEYIEDNYGYLIRGELKSMKASILHTRWDGKHFKICGNLIEEHQEIIRIAELAKIIFRKAKLFTIVKGEFVEYKF